MGTIIKSPPRTKAITKSRKLPTLFQSLAKSDSYFQFHTGRQSAKHRFQVEYPCENVRLPSIEIPTFGLEMLSGPPLADDADCGA